MTKDKDHFMPRFEAFIEGKLPAADIPRTMQDLYESEWASYYLMLPSVRRTVEHCIRNGLMRVSGMYQQ